MEDPYIRLVLTFEDGRELWFRDIRKFGRVGLSRGDPRRRATSRARSGRKGFKGFGPEPLDDGVHGSPLPVPDSGAARAA